MYRFKDWPLTREEYSFDPELASPMLIMLEKELAFRFGYGEAKDGSGLYSLFVEYRDYGLASDCGLGPNGASYTLYLVNLTMEQVDEIYREETYKAYHTLLFLQGAKRLEFS